MQSFIPIPQKKNCIRRFIGMKRIIKTILSVLVLFIGFLLLFSTHWLISKFGLLSLNEIIFQLMFPMTGTGSNMIKSFLFNNVLPGALLTALVMVLAKTMDYASAEGKIRLKRSISFKRLQAPIRFLKKHRKCILALFLISCIGYSSCVLDLKDYLKLQLTDSSFIENNYVDAKKADLKFPEKKRNLIYIYLESMESTYFSKADGGDQTVDLTPELYGLQQKNISFSNSAKSGGAFQAPGTGWTVAGMVAQSSGLPLLIPLGLNSYTEKNSFLPGTWTLGDILHQNGYRQVLLLGSDADFGGRKSYFTQHGNYQIHDYNWAVENGKIPQGYKVWWGYEDEKLFTFAKQELIQLSKSDQPFNLTFLTADTHFPDGYVCGLCKNEHDSQYENVISCSSRQVADFISWVQQQSFYDNTTIVINGDHLSMNTSLFAKLSPSYERTTLNMIINSPVTSNYTKKRTFCTFDMFPTTLAALGVKIKGERLGLGTNLFSGVPTLGEKYGIYQVTEELSRHSDFYNQTFIYNNS